MASLEIKCFAYFEICQSIYYAWIYGTMIISKYAERIDLVPRRKPKLTSNDLTKQNIIETFNLDL